MKTRKGVRVLKTSFNDEMVNLIKSSCSKYDVFEYKEREEVDVEAGLSYYKHVVWEIGEDINPKRLEREVFELFVGFDSEYKSQRKWDEWSREEAFLASISSNHVKGESIFHELNFDDRKKIEWLNKTRQNGFFNVPISYQFSVFSPQLGLMRNVVVLTQTEKKEKMVTFGNLIAFLLEKTLKGLELFHEKEKHPILRVFLVSHFSLAELQTFKDFHDLKLKFDSVRGTFLTMGSAFELNMPTFLGCKKGLDVEIILNDTVLLAPAGYQSLEALGKVVGLSKIELPSEYKEEMDRLLVDNRSLFLEYAVRDSVIALAYWIEIHVLTQKLIGRKLFQTVGSIAVNSFYDYLKKSKIRHKEFFGVTHSQYELFRQFAVKSYHGGRNESVCVGFIEGRTFYDVDLVGAYSIAMANLLQLDHSRSFTTTDCVMLTEAPQTVGFAEVEFKFPEDVVFPSLPVKTKSGLIYPREGLSFCTCYELHLAVRQGAKLRVIAGLIIPQIGVSVLQRFVCDMREKRGGYKKGTMGNNFFKLILNSLYGRFGLGISPKRFFNSRTGSYEMQSENKNSNPYFASSITGFIRGVLSECAHELSVRGYRVISMTTDGLITDCPLAEVKLLNSPLISLFKKGTRDIGQDEDAWLECKGETSSLFSWKTRGQFALDHGKISAMAGLQQPKLPFEDLKEWLKSEVAGDNVKTCIEVKRLTSLLEVYKGSPFGLVKTLKYISTQYDFKRKLVQYDNTSLSSVPWGTVKDMSAFKRKYVDAYPFKINSKESFQKFEDYVLDSTRRLKVERARKRRLQTPLRISSLLPNALKQCSRGALQGALGFSRKYKASELLDFLNKHALKEYTHGKFTSKLDSNFCKNQARRSIERNSLALSVDVFQMLSLFTKLDASFSPAELLFSSEYISTLPMDRLMELNSLLPKHINVGWSFEYQNAVVEACKQKGDTCL